MEFLLTTSSALFSTLLTRWQRQHGRHDLPWQGTRDPYRLWLSEIMLQQTQVGTVIPYYLRFLARFPDIQSLASAPTEEVMGLWSGLGYYARARNLHRAAQQLVAQSNGQFPPNADAIAELPGIGRSTAAAIAVFAFGTREAILDGNVKRVLARCFGVEGFYGVKAVENKLWVLAESLLPASGIEAYTQGLMDLGATVCTRSKPRCGACPMVDSCIAKRDGRTAELPTPRPKRAQPQKSVTLAVLHHKGRILLERRPPTGIWGGLFSLPEISGVAELPIQTMRTKGKKSALTEGVEITGVEAKLGIETKMGIETKLGIEAMCQESFGAKIDVPKTLPVVEHAFTHFRLTLNPILCEVVKLRPAVNEAQFVWLEEAQLDKAPLPAPIRKILEAFYSTN